MPSTGSTGSTGISVCIFKIGIWCFTVGVCCILYLYILYRIYCTRLY